MDVWHAEHELRKAHAIIPTSSFLLANQRCYDALSTSTSSMSGQEQDAGAKLQFPDAKFFRPVYHHWPARAGKQTAHLSSWSEKFRRAACEKTLGVAAEKDKAALAGQEDDESEESDDNYPPTSRQRRRGRSSLRLVSNALLTARSVVVSQLNWVCSTWSACICNKWCHLIVLYQRSWKDIVLTV